MAHSTTHAMCEGLRCCLSIYFVELVIVVVIVVRFVLLLLLLLLLFGLYL